MIYVQVITRGRESIDIFEQGRTSAQIPIQDVRFGSADLAFLDGVNTNDFFDVRQVVRVQYGPFPLNAFGLGVVMDVNHLTGVLLRGIAEQRKFHGDAERHETLDTSPHTFQNINKTFFAHGTNKLVVLTRLDLRHIHVVNVNAIITLCPANPRFSQSHACAFVGG